MKPSQTLQVLVDKKGRIIGALNASAVHEGHVQLRMTPLAGQSVAEVPLPRELEKLEGEEDFRRLIAEFHLPRGEKQLALKRPARESKRRTRR